MSSSSLEWLVWTDLHTTLHLITHHLLFTLHKRPLCHVKAQLAAALYSLSQHKTPQRFNCVLFLFLFVLDLTHWQAHVNPKVRDVAAKYKSQSQPGERREEMCGLAGEESQSWNTTKCHLEARRWRRCKFIQMHKKAPARKFETISIVKSAVYLLTKFVFSCICVQLGGKRTFKSCLHDDENPNRTEKKKKGPYS